MALLPLLLLAFALQDKPADLCTISGVVTDSATGARLGKTQVVLEAVEGNAPDAGTTTDAKGNFTLVDVTPGAYYLRGLRNGYLETYYGSRRANGKGITLTLGAAQDTRDLQLKLLPMAVIAGAVRDPEGEPLAQAQVALIAISYLGGVRRLRGTGDTITTDDLGQFRIPDVAPGRYYVRAALRLPDSPRVPVDHSPKGQPPPESLVAAFYPGVRDIAGARRIDVAAGDRYTGADITLVRSRLYKVRVRISGPPGLDSGVGLHERPDLSDGLGVRLSSDCNKGVCEFRGVPSGSYLATGSAQSKNMTVEELFSNSGQYRTSVPVEVADADVDDVRVVVAAAEVAGRFTVEGEDHPDLKDVHVQFVAADGDEHWPAVDKDGRFATHLGPGWYEVEVSAGGDLIAKSMRTEQADVRRDGLIVTGSGKQSLEIVLAHDGAAIAGVARDKDGQPVPGATVVLIPAPALRQQHDLYAQTTTDQYGHYSLQTLAPGEYKLFAWSDVEDGIWFDPDFLKDVESSGRLVTLEAKGHEAADLTVLQ